MKGLYYPWRAEPTTVYHGSLVLGHVRPNLGGWWRAYSAFAVAGRRNFVNEPDARAWVVETTIARAFVSAVAAFSDT